MARSIHRTRRRANSTKEARHHSRRAGGKSASPPSQEIQAHAICGLKKRRAPSFPKAPSIVSMAISRILSGPESVRDLMIIHLIRISPNARRTFIRLGATIPEDFNGPAALPLFCLAPHGVFRASRIAPRAVSSYLAFSPLPALFSKNRRYVFCDTFRQRPLSRMLPAYFTRHAAVWCSDFPPASLAAHQRSSAIGAESNTMI